MMRFLFAEESPRPAALMRIVLGTLLFCEVAAHWPYAVELYSTAGPPMPVFPGTPFEPPALGPAATVAMHTALLWLLACVALGWNTRTSLLAAAVLSTWLGLLDLPGTYKKYSVIELHLMVLLLLTNSGGAWSLDAWLRRRGGREPAASPLWPRRLMRLFLASVYLGAAVTKMKMPEFASGESLEFALLGDLFGGTRAGHWLVDSPSLLTAASLLTLMFELLFPVLVWVPRLRRPMLTTAVLFHVTAGVAMHLGWFSWVMLTGLLAFVTDADVDVVARSVRWMLGVARRRWLVVEPPRPAKGARQGDKETRRQGEEGNRHGSSPLLVSLSPCLLIWTAWLVAGALIVIAGLGWQWSQDWYGVFHDRPVVVTEIPKSLLDDILAAQAPAYADYVHRLDVGSRVGNGRTFGDPRRFRRGMIVHVLARFVLRHPAMQLDWILIAPNGREAARLSRRLEAATSHATAGFELTSDAPAGRYRVVLQCNGYDAAERTIEVIDEP